MYRRTVCNPKVRQTVVVEVADIQWTCVQVHPIFVLSIVDTLLSVLWISGALVWLTGDGLRHHGHLRVGCFSINILTVVSCFFCLVSIYTIVVVFCSQRENFAFETLYIGFPVCYNECDSHLFPPGLLQYQTERF